MGAWLWIPIVLALVVVLGRSRPDKVDPRLRSADERFETDVNRVRAMTHRHSPGGMGGGPVG